MEKSFTVKKESTYYKDLKEFCELREQQRKFIKEFFDEKGIEANKFHVSGNGLVNQAFNEYDKGEIRLDISPTENDINKFGKMLTKPNYYSLQGFRKKSVIGKEFAERCIKEEVVINLSEPDLRDYFKSIGWKGYSYQQFEFENKLYLKVSSDLLKDDDIPEGFVGIKLSEFYSTLEQYNDKNNN